MTQTSGKENIQLVKPLVVMGDSDIMDFTMRTKLDTDDRLDTECGSTTYEVDHTGSIVDIGQHQFADTLTLCMLKQFLDRKQSVTETEVRMAIEQHRAGKQKDGLGNTIAMRSIALTVL